MDTVQCACQYKVIVGRQLRFLVSLMRVIEVFRLENETTSFVDDPQG